MRPVCVKVNPFNSNFCLTPPNAALDTLGFEAEEQRSMMKTLAAILHLGNLEFEVREDSSSGAAAPKGAEGSEALALASR